MLTQQKNSGGFVEQVSPPAAQQPPAPPAASGRGWRWLFWGLGVILAFGGGVALPLLGQLPLPGEWSLDVSFFAPAVLGIVAAALLWSWWSLLIIPVVAGGGLVLSNSLQLESNMGHYWVWLGGVFDEPVVETVVEFAVLVAVGAAVCLFIGKRRELRLPRWAGFGMGAVSFMTITGFIGPAPYTFYGVLGANVLLVVVIAAFWRGREGMTFVRWWAQTFSPALAYLLSDFVYRAGWPPPDIGVTILWTVLLAGIALAFFWEGIGGAVEALAALALLGLSIARTGADAFQFQSVILVFVCTGLALVGCWWFSRQRALTYRPA